jgi:DNA invertase Pin-like site-specific DNA recombinase
MVYGYIRVSTDMQDCHNQKIGIEEFATRKGLKVDRWIEDQGVSGTKDPKKRNLGKLMKILKPGDHVIASEISRLGRELFMIFKILENFTEKGILLDTVKDNYHLDNSITSKVLAFAFGMAANIERDMISKRTIEGLAARKRAGVVFGRPLNAKSKTKKLDAKEQEIKKLLELGTPISTIGRIVKAHRMTVSSIIKERGWQDHFTEHKKKLMGKTKNNVKIKYPPLKTTKEEILTLYREHKSLQTVAEQLGTNTDILKRYLLKKKWWDDLVELDKQLRKEIPSLSSQGENGSRRKRY